MASPSPLGFAWRSEGGAPAPVRLSPVDDRLTADVALARLRRGESLLYTGDWNNGRQLLAALGRRLSRPTRARDALEAFRVERNARHREHAILSRLVVQLDPDYGLHLRRAPEVAEACRALWGESEIPTVVPFKMLLGMLGAAGWQRTGLTVPGLEGRLHPHYGVYLPTRTDYVGLVAAEEGVEGKRVLEIGTGTGVLSFLLLQRGALHAVATDLDPRAVACARENAERLGLAGRFTALEADLYDLAPGAHLPDGRADLVVCNPPWIPETPKSRLDRAVFDEGGRMLEGFLAGLAAHLTPGGEGLLLLSDLAVRLGLRDEHWLSQRIAAAGLEIVRTRATGATHGKSQDRADPLHAARVGETTTLYVLAARRAG